MCAQVNTSKNVNDDVENTKRFRVTPSQQMISSCTGAIITSLLVTPLDVVKIRLQSQQSNAPPKRCFVYCNGLMDHISKCCPKTPLNTWANRPGHFSSTADAFKKIVRNEGLLSLWSGLPPTLIMAIPATVMYFVSYETLRVKMIDQYRASTGLQEYPVYLPLMAGGFARWGVVTVVNPLELIRTKMQAKKISYAELKVACAELYKARGIRGFWIGYVSTIARDVPFSAMYWGCYEAQKKLFNMQQEPTPPAFSFAAGAIAGSIAGTITLPFDVVKTRKQVEIGEVDFNIKDKKVATTMDVLRLIYRQNGIGGLFAGLLPRVMKIAPACAIMISTFEYGKSYFVKYNQRKYGAEIGEQKKLISASA